jgi:hypothetical protein
MGPDRLTMLRYGVNDLRLFFEATCASCASSANPPARKPRANPKIDMQFPESWLREFCNPPLTTQATGRHC